VPRSRNIRLRPKNTSRAEARRRHRDEQRELDADAVEPIEIIEDEPVGIMKRASMFQLPNVLDDIKALPQVFRKPLVWLPFGLLALTLGLSLALINGMLDDLPEMVTSGLTLYISLTLHPTSLFIFFIGGFLASRASYIVGGMLGVLSGVIYLTVVGIATDVARETNATTLGAAANGEVPDVSSELILQTMGMGLVIGVFAGGFASWYRRFLRSSQERAAANRAAKERDQAEKAKEQARTDREELRQQKYADREARRKSGE
jgi:signal transduction histidine kinase